MPSLQDLPALPTPSQQQQAPRGEEREAVELRIALVGEVRGEIEPCGCPTLPYGGFERRERLLSELDGPLFHLDAGETLLEGFSAARLDRAARSAVVLELSALVGVDAWAPGPSDLTAIGVEGLKRAPITAVSATWQDVDGSLLLPPWTVVEEDGVKLGVIGLSAEVRDPELRDAVVSVPPVQAAQAALASMPEGLDLVVGLGTITDQEASAVAELDGIAAVLSTRGREYEMPRETADGLVVEVPSEGRYVELMHVRVGTQPGAPLRQLPAGRIWQEILTLRTQLTVAQEPERVAQLQAALDAREATLAEEGRGRNVVFVENVPLTSALDGPADSAVVLSRFKDDWLASAATAAAAVSTHVEPGYAGAGRCTGCHESEKARWVLTDHTAAWRSLLLRDEADNPECIRCHSTGFGEPGGFGELSTASVRKYKAVQCESCHGPMRGHPEDDKIEAVPVTEQTCLVCHDEANSPDFDYTTYLRRASCQQ